MTPKNKVWQKYWWSFNAQNKNKNLDVTCLINYISILIRSSFKTSRSTYLVERPDEFEQGSVIGLDSLSSATFSIICKYDAIFACLR